MKMRISFLFLIVICIAILTGCGKTYRTEIMQVGDYVQYGNYAGEPIVWRVINIDPNSCYLLYSEKIITLKAFDAFGDEVDYQGDGIEDTVSQRPKLGSNYWEKSNIREWLNSEDTKVAFSHQEPDEQHVIYRINVDCQQ